MVPDMKDIPSLRFDRQRILGDQEFKVAFVGLGSGPERLICEQDQAVLEMEVEVPREMTLIRNMDEVMTEYTSEIRSKATLPGPLLSSKHNADARPFPSRLLDRLRHPCQ